MDKNLLGESLLIKLASKFKVHVTLIIHQVPAFETQDGKCIYESNAIAYYGIFLTYYSNAELNIV